MLRFHDFPELCTDIWPLGDSEVGQHPGEHLLDNAVCSVLIDQANHLCAVLFARRSVAFGTGVDQRQTEEIAGIFAGEGQ